MIKTEDLKAGDDKPREYTDPLEIEAVNFIVGSRRTFGQVSLAPESAEFEELVDHFVSLEGMGGNLHGIHHIVSSCENYVMGALQEMYGSEHKVTIGTARAATRDALAAFADMNGYEDVKETLKELSEARNAEQLPQQSEEPVGTSFRLAGKIVTLAPSPISR